MGRHPSGVRRSRRPSRLSAPGVGPGEVAYRHERLASLSAERPQRLYGVVIPRDTRFVKLVISAINLALRLRRQRVRAAVVPTNELERILRKRGLSRCFSGTVGPAWQVTLYRRD